MLPPSLWNFGPIACYPKGTGHGEICWNLIWIMIMLDIFRQEWDSKARCISLCYTSIAAAALKLKTGDLAEAEIMQLKL